MWRLKGDRNICEFRKNISIMSSKKPSNINSGILMSCHMYLILPDLMECDTVSTSNINRIEIKIPLQLLHIFAQGK